MSDAVKIIENKINKAKEFLNLLPKNGIKKLRDFHLKLDDLIEEYSKFNNIVIKEIENRYSKIINQKENTRIKILQQQIEELDNVTLECEGETSFEKLQLDRLVYDLNGYYKKDLEVTNKNIYECIENFRKTGVEIMAEDFIISEYAYKYIKVLLEEAEKGDMNSEIVKNTFEEIYWNCSELIYHILVNIRYIYEQNKMQFDKYFSLKKEEMMKNFNYQDLKQRKEKILKEYDDIISCDEKTILDSFINKTLFIGDYKKENYEKIYSNLIKNIDEKYGNIQEDVKKLNNNLLEYQRYLEYKFINEEVLKVKQESEKKKERDKKENKKQKTEYELVKEEIVNLIKQIFKINIELEKNNKKKIFSAKLSKREIKNKILQRDNNIIKLKDLYAKMDDIELKEGIYQNIDEASKILDVLIYAGNNYGFLARTLIKNNSEITDKEIAQEIQRYRQFLRTYRFSVINNININEKQEISIIIKDKYTLTGFNLAKEDFSENSLDDIIKQTEIIKNYYNIQKSNITIEDIQFVLNAKEILKK